LFTYFRFFFIFFKTLLFFSLHIVSFFYLSPSHILLCNYAATARDWGLVNRVVPAERLDDEIDELARTILAHSAPVIANGKLYLRDQDLLFCYDVAAK